MKLIDSSRRFWGRFWSHIYFEENSVMVTDAWDEVTCLDEATDGRKCKIWRYPRYFTRWRFHVLRKAKLVGSLQQEVIASMRWNFTVKITETPISCSTVEVPAKNNIVETRANVTKLTTNITCMYACPHVVI